MSSELEHIWSRVQAELARAVDESTYRIWLDPLQATELSGGRLLVAAPPQACGWICDRFGRLLQASATLVLGAETLIELVPHPGSPVRRAAIHPDPSPQRGAWLRPPHPAHGEHPRANGQDSPALPPEHRAGPLDNPKLNFNQFVIGDCNRLAHAAALTVAEMPAHAYNPLFIFGPPGVGKTHLLSSIGSLVLSHNPGLAVRCTTGEAFTNEFLGALMGGHTESFKARFRDIDVLLIDDVHFLERKTKTEEEFFHTFNALYDGGRQIVLTSDRPPRDLQALEDRLRERFESGLVADIKPPELATRLAILRKRVQHDGVRLADEGALSVLAERIPHNVRALEGALIRVVAYGSLAGRALTAELTSEVLDNLYPGACRRQAREPRPIADIQAATCAYFGISFDELLSPARVQRLAWPRQLAMYLARELTDESLPAIGRQFGGRDHTTVLHACRRACARLDIDDVARRAVEKLRQELDGSPTNHGGSRDRAA